MRRTQSCEDHVTLQLEDSILSKILNKYLRSNFMTNKYVNKGDLKLLYDCQEELIAAGLDEYAQI